MNTTDIEKVATVIREEAPSHIRKTAFAAAALVFDRAGRGEEPLPTALRKMASDDPGPTANPVMTAIHYALGCSSERHIKVAVGIPTAVAGGARALLGGGATAADVAKILAGAGLLTGGVMGAGAFGLKRHLDKEDTNILKKEQERDIMAQLSKEIEQELRIRNLEPTPENKAAVADYLT